MSDEERYGDFLPPRAPDAKAPPRFDPTQHPGRPVDAPPPDADQGDQWDAQQRSGQAQGAAPGWVPPQSGDGPPPGGIEPLPPPPPGRQDPPPPPDADPWDNVPPPPQDPPVARATGWASGTRSRDGTNGYAVAALILGIAGLVLFVLGPFGLAFILNLPASILAWVFGVKGRKKVDSGELTRQRGIAQAGMWLGITGVVVGILGVIGWALVLTFDEGVRNDFINEFERALERSK